MRPYAFILLAATFITAVAAMQDTAAADEDFSIVVDGRTGEAFLRNDSNSSVDLDGYLLRSPGGNLFDPNSWDSLQDNPATPGWSESFAAANRLGEANLFGSSSVAPGGTLSIGSPYLPFVPSAIGEPEPGLNSIEFEYSLASGGAFSGDVEFISRNTVVLVIDQFTGEASLENQSEFDVDIDAYRILSAPAVLDADGWMPLAVSLGGGGGWTASTGAANRLAEGNLFGSSFLVADGGSLPLGSPINPAMLDDETDLVLEVSVAGVGSITGGVLFTGVAPDLPGDYNGNGVVDAADYTVWRDRFGQNVALLNEVDGVTPGIVTREDYDEWKARFGNTAGAGSGSGSSALAIDAVPEPTTGGLAWLGVLVLGGVRRLGRAA
jgi:hypothetical protein